jgi:hypothetical protein
VFTVEQEFTIVAEKFSLITQNQAP